MADLYVFKASFDPILLPNQTATLKGSDFPPEGQPVRCRGVGALPEYIRDWGNLTAATWSLDNEDTNLEMGSNELAQFRMRVLDNIQVRFKNPSPVQQWKSLRATFSLYMWPTDESDFLKEYLFRTSEFFVWEDSSTPRFDLYSTPGVSVARMWFGGYRFKLEKIAKKDLTSPVEIWINSWPVGKT